MADRQRAMTRKEFLSGGVLDVFRILREAVQPARAARPARPAVRAPAVLRPPGALPEAEFRERCTRCDDCIRACPHWVIRKAGPELGALAGTPVIVPTDNPCLMCDGLPCAAACTTGALAPGGAPRIGLAVVNVARCYSAQGQPCDYCSVNCPVRPRAIERFARGATPVVIADRCTGCGACAQLCPARAVGITDVRSSGGTP